MKTKNNVQKTTFRLAVLFSGILFAGISTANNAGDHKGASTITIENSADKKLIVENWMTDENYFSADAMGIAAYEAPLETEPWMAGENKFATTTIPASAADEVLEIESWMTDGNKFTTGNLFEQAKDEPMTLEEWMTNETFFGNTDKALAPAKDNELAIEDWMLDDFYW